MSMKSNNPATGEIIKRYTPNSDQEIEAVTEQAHLAYKKWREIDPATRAQHVNQLANILENTTGSVANLITTEMGKTLGASHAELEKCIQYCQFMAENGESYLTENHVKTEYKQAFTRPLPLGVILLVMPWNFPFWQVIRVAIAAILAGNTCVLKHASNVSGCALALEDMFLQSGFPTGVFRTLLIPSNRVDMLINDERIKAVSLTGSEAAGSAIASACGKAIKKCVLELGGSDPFIVMPSADLDAAIDAAFISRMRNNGQSCIAAKRLIIHTDIYEAFKTKFVKRMNELTIGDPLDPSSDMGPLSSKRALQNINNMLAQARSQGAKLTRGTQNIPSTGCYIHPSILENMDNKMDIYTQEIFAPVAMLFRVYSFSEAINLANDTPYGLSSVLYSNDVAEHQETIARLDAGSTYINRYASSDIRLPFGGIKKSGYGREMAREGLREFTNLKTIIIAN